MTTDTISPNQWAAISKMLDGTQRAYVLSLQHYERHACWPSLKEICAGVLDTGVKISIATAARGRQCAKLYVVENTETKILMT